MQNSHRQEAHIPICFHTRIAEDFSGVHGSTSSIPEECTLFKNGELQVRVLRLKTLLDEAAKDLLVSAEMPFREFEAYYKYLQATLTFEALVDLSGETLKK